MTKEIYAIETKTRYAGFFRPNTRLDFVYDDLEVLTYHCATYVIHNQQIRYADINIYSVFEATTQYKMAANKNNKLFSVSLRRRFGKLKVTQSSRFKESRGK